MDLTFSFLRPLGELHINPHWKTAEVKVKDILTQFKIEYPTEGQFGYHTAISYPEIDLKLLTLSLLWLSWIWLIDDILDTGDQMPLIRELIRATYGYPPGIDNNYLNLLIYILKSVEHTYPWIGKKHRRVVREYLEANFNRNKPKTWEEFLVKRSKDSGCESCFIFIEIWIRSLHPEFKISPDVRRAQLNANLILSLSNDLFSIEKEKELTEHRSLNSMIFWIERGLSVKESILRIHSLIESLYLHFEQILDLVDPISQKYLEGLKSWILGTVAWVLYVTPRYRSLTSPFPELRLTAKL